MLVIRLLSVKILGLDNQSAIGRLKLKSAVKDAYTLWITQVKLVRSGESTQPETLPDVPVPDTDVGELPDPSHPSNPPVAELQNLVRWHLDPGVSGEITDHQPSRTVTLNANGQDSLDDTASLISALATISNGGIVDIPAGTFYVSSTINLNSDRQVLRGGEQYVRASAPLHSAQ